MFTGTSGILSVVVVALVDSLAECHVRPISFMCRKLPSKEANCQLQCELAEFRECFTSSNSSQSFDEEL